MASLSLYHELTFAILVAFLLSTAWVAKPFLKRKPNDTGAGVKTLSVNVWTFTLSALIGASCGLIMLTASRSFLSIFGGQPFVWKWAAAIAPLTFFPTLVYCGQFFWNEFCALQKIQPAHRGVLLFLGERVRRIHLHEGEHRLPKFLALVEVNTQRQPQVIEPFQELTSDNILMTIAGAFFWRISSVDNFLDHKDALETLKNVFEDRARTYVRSTPIATLLTSSGQYGLAKAVIAELKAYDTSLGQPGKDERFLDQEALDVKIGQLEPPAKIIETAAARTAQEEENRRKMLELTGLAERFRAFVQANTGLDPAEAARVFQRSERLIESNEIIVRGFEGILGTLAQDGKTDPRIRAAATELASQIVSSNRPKGKGGRK